MKLFSILLLTMSLITMPSMLGATISVINNKEFDFQHETQKNIEDIKKIQLIHEEKFNKVADDLSKCYQYDKTLEPFNVLAIYKITRDNPDIPQEIKDICLVQSLEKLYEIAHTPNALNACSNMYELLEFEKQHGRPLEIDMTFCKELGKKLQEKLNRTNLQQLDDVKKESESN